MFLSRVELTSRWARDPYQWHRALWQLFSDRPEAQRDFLFRVEQLTQGRAVVLMQSQTQPVGDAGGARVIASKPYLPEFQTGQAVRFHLVANPVKTIRDSEGRLNAKGESKSCRVPLIKEEQQIAWLQRKLQGVAEIGNVQAVARSPLYFRKNDIVGKVATVAFDGILSVRDPDCLTSVLRTGIGPAKSFGCGLLSIARL